MNLREYMFRKRISIKEMAELLDISRVHLGKITRHGHPTNAKLAKLIQQITDGNVTIMECLYPEDFKDDYEF